MNLLGGEKSYPYINCSTLQLTQNEESGVTYASSSDHNLVSNLQLCVWKHTVVTQIGNGRTWTSGIRASLPYSIFVCENKTRAHLKVGNEPLASVLQCPIESRWVSKPFFNASKTETLIGGGAATFSIWFMECVICFPLNSLPQAHRARLKQACILKQMRPLGPHVRTLTHD